MWKTIYVCRNSGLEKSSDILQDSAGTVWFPNFVLNYTTISRKRILSWPERWAENKNNAHRSCTGNDNLRIVVSDNGCGMSPAQLQYVHSLLAANVASKVISEESPRTGIGLVNVNNRLVL